MLGTLLMITGMACRLCFDMGLNQDGSALGLSQEEIKVRQTVLWACILYDKSVPSHGSPKLKLIELCLDIGPCI